MARVSVVFDGENRGALAAARGTRTAIGSVAKESKAASRELAVTERQIGRTTRGVLAGSGAFRSLGRSIGFASAYFLGAAGFTALVRSALTQAAALGAQIDQNTAVFGRNARGLQAWARTTAHSLGLAAKESLGFANNVGSALKALDVAPKLTAEWSKRIVILAANLGALNQRPPEEFIRDFDQALLGRTRGLKSWGVIIDDVQIKAEALRLGLVRSTVDSGKLAAAQTKLAIEEAKLAKAIHDHGANSVAAAEARLKLTAAEDSLSKTVGGSVANLTAAQRAQAVYELTLRKTADANGFLAKHADRADIVNKRLHATLTDIEAKIGNALLPTLVDLGTQLEAWLSKSENQEKVTHAVRQAVDGLIGAVKVAVPIIRQAWTMADGIAKALGGWESALKLVFAAWVFSKFAKMALAFQTLSGAKGIGGTITQLAKLRLAAAAPIIITAYIVTKHLPQDPRIPNPLKGIPIVGDVFGFGQYTGSKVFGMPKGGPGITRTPPQGAVTTGSDTLPATFKSTHPTLGLSGFPAIDIFRNAGTVVGSPVDGVVTRLSGRPWSAGWSSGPGSAIGLSIYIQADNGDTYFLTHFASVLVKPGQPVKRGTPLGVVGDMGKSSHIHEGVHRGGVVTPAAPSGTTPAAAKTGIPHLTEAGGRTDQTKIPGPLRLQISQAEGTRGLGDDVSAYRALLKLYLSRIKKKGLTADERADLQDAINETRKKIRDVNDQIKKATADQIAKDQKELSAWLQSVVAKAAAYIKAQKQARTAMGEGASVLATLLGFDQNASFQIQDKFGRAITITISQVVRKVQALLNNLDKAVASGNVKAIRAAVKAWQGYAGTIASAVQAGSDAAQKVLEEAHGRLDTALGRLASRLWSAFDRETQRNLEGMQAATSRQVEQLTASVDADITRLQRRLQQRIDQLELSRRALTPEELAARDFQSAHDAAQAAQDMADALKALADAQAAGDDQAAAAAQQRINDLTYQLQLEDLQRKADASREARDKEIQDQEEALRAQEQQQEDSLRKQLEQQIKALQDAEKAREQDYQDQREAQRQALSDQLDDWIKHLQDGSASWRDFVSWLQGLGGTGAFGADMPDPVAAMADAGGAQGSAFAQAFIDELQAAWDAYVAFMSNVNPDFVLPGLPNPWSSGPGGGGGGAGGYARGGKIGGRFIGREDTIMARVTPGENVTDRRLTKALEDVFVHGRGSFGGGPVYDLRGGTFLGGTERQVFEALGRATKPYQDRLSSYRSPI